MNITIKKNVATAKRRSGKIARIILFFTLHPVAWLLYHGKTIYLFSERGQDARDNGFYMYRYFRTQHPELNSYFVIDPKSADYEKVHQLGETVKWRSIRHYLLYIAAKYKISTHVMGCAPDKNLFYKLSKFYDVKGKQIFLQHGVIADNIEGLYREKTKVDLFICGAKPEYDFVSSNFHYRHGEVKYTGLARYDGLQRFRTKRQILLMPTWRHHLSGATQMEFCNSAYFQHWNNLLLDKRLQCWLKRTNLQLVFYPHFEIQKYIDSFSSPCSNIVIADFEHYDVQALLKESMLLVTDYSSVHFDFAYMRKPCIYYQFDKDEFLEDHCYHHGYFDFLKMGFGPVCTDEDTCVDAIVQQLKCNCVATDEYVKRMDSFFPLHDDKNCERIFKEIEALH